MKLLYFLLPFVVSFQPKINYIQKKPINRQNLFLQQNNNTHIFDLPKTNSTQHTNCICDIVRFIICACRILYINVITQIKNK